MLAKQEDVLTGFSTGDILSLRRGAPAVQGPALRRHQASIFHEHFLRNSRRSLALQASIPPEHLLPERLRDRRDHLRQPQAVRAERAAHGRDEPRFLLRRLRLGLLLDC